MDRTFISRILLTFFCATITVTNAQSCSTSICRCSDNIIDCQDENITSIPTFTTDYFHTTVQLDKNRLTTVPREAFRNLFNISTLLLQDNFIYTIEADAFHGIERTVLNIDLFNNNLTSVPTAIGDLLSIRWLNLKNNPINSDQFDEQTMYQIGDTLEKIEFGSNSLSSWPTTIRHLQNLQVLNVTGGSFYTLPPDAFHGFEGTLKTLSIQNTNLIALPLALSRLRFLDTLHFDHNHDIGDSGVLIPSFGSSEILNNLRTISLIDDNLTIFPSLLKYLRHVNTLILDSNRLAFVSDASVQDVVGTAIRTLSLRNCTLSRVPGALSKLTHLESIDLTTNNIRSFENSDFEGMQNLSELKINDNPLEFIANESFKDLICLRTLSIMDSNIKTIPEAIGFLGSLQTLNLPLDTIECTCNIVWLKQFIDHCNKGLKIAGSCETINSNVENYLQNHINGTCPNYIDGMRCYSRNCPNP